MTDVYDTPLTPDQEQSYSQSYGPEDSHDYDMRGYYADTGEAAHTDGTHYPDTYKKPWHPTFSDQSMYHGVAGNLGGHWGVDDKGGDTFTPGPANVQLHGLLGLMDYIDKTDPNVTLMMPKAK